MIIDLPTLMLAASFVEAVCGAFLVFAWLQNRESAAPLWWAGANFTLAIGVPMLVTSNQPLGLPSGVLGILFLNLSPALVWAAAVDCNNRKPNPVVIGAGAAIWLLAFVTTYGVSPGAALALNLAVIAIYLLAAAAEFSRGGTEGLQTRRPLIVLLVLHGLFFAIGAVLAASGRLVVSGPPRFDSWLGLIHFETLAFAVGTAIFAVALVKEQREREQKEAASVDSLTGVSSRAAFLESASAAVRSSTHGGSSLALVIFDLDSFKSINDTYGHPVGDRVLEQFGRVARGVLRRSDVVGRMGGEEFAAVLPGSGAAPAARVAERIRAAFVEACNGLEIADLRPTLSGGVAAITGGSATTLDELYAAADRALYRAKAEGRDRIIVADEVEEDQSLMLMPEITAQAA